MKNKKYIEPINPTELVNKDIYNELINYPISINQIIECCLRTEKEINESHKYLFGKCNAEYISVVRPAYASSTAFGSVWEHEIRHRLNKLGIIKFIEGEHNTSEDCTCNENNYWSIEIKTRNGSLSFNNTNDNGRTQRSTKYANNGDLEEHFYILVAHHVNMKEVILQTHAYKIFFGKLCKRDFKNPNGTGAAYLTNEIRNNKCIEIWNNEIGNTMEHYQAWYDNDYYEKMIELENEIKGF